VPSGPHTHVLGNDSAVRASAPLSEAEQRAVRDQYLN